MARRSGQEGRRAERQEDWLARGLQSRRTAGTEEKLIGSRKPHNMSKL